MPISHTLVDLGAVFDCVDVQYVTKKKKKYTEQFLKAPRADLGATCEPKRSQDAKRQDFDSLETDFRRIEFCKKS